MATPVIMPRLGASMTEGTVSEWYVGDGENVCDAKPLLRRHLIAFLLDLYLVHRRPPIRIWYFSVRQNTSGSCASALN